MKKSSKRLTKRQSSNHIALARAREFSEYHSTFSKFANRKNLKPSEKAQITKKWRELLNITGEAGGFGYISVVKPKTVQHIKKLGYDDLLLDGFNIMRLNRYEDDSEIEVTPEGNLRQKRKYKQSDRHDLQQGRTFTFIPVYTNYFFNTGAYDDLVESGEIYDDAKAWLTREFIKSYKRNKKIAKTPCEFYLWGKQGVMYKYVATDDFSLLVEALKTWIDLYLDKVIEANGALSNEIYGWCFHRNVQIRKPQKRKPKPRGKKNRNR